MGNILERFEAKFTKGENCWEWHAAKTKQGYGQFGYKGMMRGAHRVSYELYVAPIPDGMQVLHRCDNPSCVNPKHLWLGTNADNVKDKCEKGRMKITTGAAHHNAVLTDASLAELRKLYATGFYTHRALAFKFKVSKSTISYALKGKTYANS